MAVYNVHGGHNKIVPGASSYLDEVTEDRKVTAEVISLLKSAGHTVYNCTDDAGRTQSANLANIVAKCNAHTAELDVSIHFNAAAKDVGDGKVKGVEVYVYSSTSKAKDAAARVCANISALGFTNRGVKTSTSLYVLNHTKAPAMLIEVCFVDDKDDADLYNKVGYKAIAQAIAGGTIGQTVSAPAQTDNLYRVRKTWADASSQIGAYSSLDNAKNACKSGYSVFDSAGNVVYTVPATTVSVSAGATSEDTLTIDGLWGPSTIKRLQQIFGTTEDGVISNQYASEKTRNPGLAAVTGWEWKTKPSGSSALIKAIQKKVGTTQDGYIGKNTIKAMQKWLGATSDGVISNPSAMVKSLQKWANQH